MRPPGTREAANVSNDRRHTAIPAHVEHRVTVADGRTIAVAEWGDPDGLPLFTVHGTPGSRISWWQDPTIYARHGLRRLSVDRAGYGDSTRNPGAAWWTSPATSPRSPTPWP
jgi:pimeloyl-ACP methyl ester carboxylesterase